MTQLLRLPKLTSDLFELIRQRRGQPANIPFGWPHPCLGDFNSESGDACGHYFHQDFFVARSVIAAQPLRHIDIGSRIDGFVAHVACSRPIEIIDIRPLRVSLHNMTHIQADVMGELPEAMTDCCDSLSCLHALEHFGLGRYGDPVRQDGHVVGLANMARLLRPRGRLYLSVPIGAERIEFNAHRVFSIASILGMLDKDFEITSFSYVDDAGRMHEHAPLTSAEIQNNFGCHYGCGIFVATKRTIPPTTPP